MKLIILDRDGVINEDSDDYIKCVADWHPVPGSLEAIGQLSRAGWKIYVASNQAGIGRGLFDHNDLQAIHTHMRQQLAKYGGRLDGILFAPEHPEHATHMRKPKPGMLEEIGRRTGANLKDVPFVGDSISDIRAALAASARPILVRSGKGRRTETEHDLSGIAVFDDLASYVRSLLGQSTS